MSADFCSPQGKRTELSQSPLPLPPKAGSRNKEPLSAAAKQVIRNQKLGGCDPNTQRSLRHRQPPRLAASTKTRARMADKDKSAALPARPPTLQEMYNSWRALEEQVDGIHRLPMFIRARRRACHQCRVLGKKCDCFDFSELEKKFQVSDLALKQAVLRKSPFLDEPESSSKPAPSDEGVSAMASTRQWLQSDGPVESFGPRGREIDERGRPIHSHSLRDSVAAGAIGAASSLSTVPKLVKLEIHSILIAQERIRNNVRRWRCQFGSGLPGGHICLREDDYLNTIRRHYGREHGKHRYHMKPKLRLRCSSCGFAVETRAPDHCPGCNGDRHAWVQELYALIEVPVPLGGGEADRQAGAPSTPALPSLTIPTTISTPATLGLPTTPLTPLTPLSATPASGDGILPTDMSMSSMFPYGVLGIDWPQQPLFTDSLFTDDSLSCGIDLSPSLGLDGGPVLQAPFPMITNGSEGMDWNTQ